MKKDNLYKKLEKILLPEIEIPSHKKELKQILLNKYYKEKRSWEIFNIFKKVIPIGAVAVILAILFVNNFILPSYTLTQAREIAIKDPQIQNLIEKGAVIQDIKVLKDKGYVLLQGQQETEEAERVAGVKEESFVEEFFSALAEVDLKNKKVSQIREILPQSYDLAEQEKERIKEIANSNSEVRKIVPPEAEVKEIIPLPYSELKLAKEKDSIKVIPENIQEKKARIIYELDSSIWEGEIDLNEEKVEGIKSLVKPKD